MPRRPAEHGPKCTGRVPIKGPDDRFERDDDGKVKTRPCKNYPIAGAKVCGMHGAAAPQVKAKAAVVAEVMRWGLGDAKVDPGEVLLRLVSQSAARAERYAAELEALIDEAAAAGKDLRDALIREAWGEFGPTGEYARGLVQLEAQERDRCAGMAAKAIAAGIAERQVRIAEKQASVMAELIEAALHGAGVTGPEFLAGRKAAAQKLRLIQGIA